MKNGEQVLGAVWFPEKVLRDPYTRILAQPWLVPKDQSTAAHRQLDPELGEFKVGYTARRWRELSQKGMTPGLTDAWRPFHIIQPQYCLMISIEPDDMIVKVIQDAIARKIEQEIETNFAEISTDISLTQRVYLAHEKAWLKFGSYDELMSFVKEKFFSNL